jgi:subtilisin
MPRRFGPIVYAALLAATSLSFNPQGKAEAGKAQPQVDVLIAFKTPPGPNEHALVRKNGGTVKHSFWIVPAVAARVPLQAVQALQNNPNVDVVEPDGIVLADDLELDNAWGVKRIGAGIVHAEGFTGTGVKVAVLDTGIDYNHPDLAPLVAGGWDFVNNDAYPLDDHSHGTHIAGTIAAVDNDVGVVGVAPNVQLYAVKVLNASGSGSWSTIIAGIQWCVQNGIHVTNNSYGGTSNPGTTVRQAYDNAYAAGVVMVASAGNSGTSAGDTNTVNYPGAFDSVIAVGATNTSNTRPSWSSTGPQVELAAPGASIYSTMPGGGYGKKSGTSMACPHVVGAVAQVMAAGVMNPQDVREVLAATTVELGSTGWDSWYGFGLVDVPAAVALAMYNPDPTPPPPEPDPTPEPPLEAGPVFVASITYGTYGGSAGKKHLTTTVLLVDENGAAVASAGVSVRISRGTTTVLTSSGTTDSNGRVTFTVSNAKAGTYSTLVTNVAASPLVWDGQTPVNTFSK